MKNYLLSLLLFAFTFSSYGQTILFSEDFNAGTTSQFTLNAADMNSTGTNSPNQWVINNAYTGSGGQRSGTANIFCPIFNSVMPVGIIWNSHTTSPQPAGITGNPNSSYLHITDVTATQIGVSNATFIIADNLCIASATNFVKMTNGISTIGYNNINLSFWWICGGDVAIYGLVYYSTDGGTTWLPIPYGKYTNSQTWQQAFLSLPDFANQPDLRFGFQWVNKVPGPNLIKDPSFSLDDITVTADAPPSCNASFYLYPDSIIEHQWYAINLAHGAPPITYTWSWGDGATSNGPTPSHIYSSGGMYNICLSITDNNGCSSSFCDSAKVYRTDGTPIAVNVTLPKTALAVQQPPATNTISIYPNPTKDNITISGISPDAREIFITNVLGQTVLTASIAKTATDNLYLQLPQAPGIYFVHLRGTAGDYVGKVVKE